MANGAASTSIAISPASRAESAASVPSRSIAVPYTTANPVSPARTARPRRQTRLHDRTRPGCRGCCGAYGLLMVRPP